MYYKYPRTFHLPWSLGISSDDKVLHDVSVFSGKNVVVTEKMDGENSTLYKDYMHARSIDSRNHDSRNWVKNFWSSIRYSIPDGWRICGENLYAVHSIAYEDLESYFYGFSVWNDNNFCLSWDDTIEWFSMLGIVPVRELYCGVFDIEKIKSLYSDADRERMEGYVVRTDGGFSYEDFGRNVVKFVRAGHVSTDEHWMSNSFNKNILKGR